MQLRTPLRVCLPGRQPRQHTPNAQPVLRHLPDKAPQSPLTQPRAPPKQNLCAPDSISAEQPTPGRFESQNRHPILAVCGTHQNTPLLTTHQCTPLLTSTHRCSQANMARLAGTELESPKAKHFIPPHGTRVPCGHHGWYIVPGRV